MKKYTILVSLLLIAVLPCVKVEDTPSLVIDLFRHGARAPSSGIDPSWEVHDELTEVGMRQHYVLGAALAKKYPHLLEKYDASKIYVRSTNFNRTLMSATSQLQGMFEGKAVNLGDGVEPTKMTPPFNNPTLINKITEELKDVETALPNKLQLIPIHSLDLAADELLYSGPGNCANSSLWYQQKMYDTETVRVHKTLTETIEYLKTKKYEVPQLVDFSSFGDTIISSYFADKTLLADIKYQDKHYKNTEFAYQWFVNYLFGGTDLSLRAFSYKLMNQILDWFNAKVEGKTPLEFIMLSSHDTTLLHLLGLFDITHPACLEANHQSQQKGEETQPFPECVYPGFASQILLELYTPENADPYVKFIYNSNVIKICNKQETCTLKDFQDLTTKLLDLTPEQYNQICALPNKSDGGDILKIILITIIIALVLFVGLYATYVYLKNKKEAAKQGDYASAPGNELAA